MNLQTKPSLARPAFPVGRSTIDKSHIETIADGKLYALQNVMELDGRVSAYPANARGYSLKTTLVSRAETLHVGEARAIEVFQAPIRLINTRWMFDYNTRTLFTSDSFSHQWSDSADGPWSITSEECTTTAGHIRSFLLNTRYWWLEGGKTTELRRKLAAVFEKYPIETIAPGYGQVLRGRALVERQYSMFDDVLARLDQSVISPKYVDRDELR